MKKNLLILALVMFCFVGLQAQKQIGGDKLLEVSVAPFGETPVSIGGIQFRAFTSETTAIRVGLFLGGMTDEMVTTQADEIVDGSNELYDITKSFGLALAPGIELHMEGTDNLSPYIGGVVDFAIGNTSTETESYGPSEIDQAPGNWGVWSMTENNSTTRFGIFAIAGTDYYFADNIYFGFEIAFGFSSMSYGDTEYETSNDVAYSLANGGGDGSAGNPLTDLPPAEKNDKMSTWGPSVNGSFRFGWIFSQ